MLPLQKQKPLYQQVSNEKSAKKLIFVSITSMLVTAIRKKAVENNENRENNEYLRTNFA